MNKKELLLKKEEMEAVNEQLRNELSYIDFLMRKVGFTDGLATVKATAAELADRLEDEDKEAA